MKHKVRFFTACVLIVAPVVAAQSQRELVPEDVYRLEAVSDPQLSPDGQWVAYVVTSIDKAKNKRVPSIWLVPADGSGDARAFINDVPARFPRWSSDGKWLAFLSDGQSREKSNEALAEKSSVPEPAARNQVWRVARDGSDRHVITHFTNGVTGFSWSPDGAQLAVVTRSGGKPRDVRHYTSMMYKRDGSGWSSESHSHIWVVSTKDGDGRQLTDGADSDDSDPKWSPNGQWISYLSSQASADLRAVNGSDAILVIPSHGGEPRTICDRRMYVGSPAWSPDSKQLAYAAAPTTADQPLLWVAPVADPDKAALASDIDLFPLEVEWDASGLWFGAHERGTSPLYRVDLTTRHALKVIGGDRAVHELRTSDAAGRLVYLENDDTHAHDVFSSDVSGGHERQLTFQNRGALTQVHLAPSERLLWKGADGLTIEGFFKRPVGWQPGRKYPMILAIHGGPNGMFGFHWEVDEQLYAANGYAVLLTNPRGSSGYGTNFQRAVANEWGGQAYQDIMHGVQAALEKYPWLDRQRLGVVGHSYGGFMTDWIVTQTDAFKAAISIAGISDFVSVEGTRDAAYGHARDFGGDLYSNFQEYWKYSPVRLAANVRTPILFLHGEADNRVPVSQSEEYFRAIKHFGGTAELVIFPRESHMLPLNAEPQHLVETYRWRLYWFDRYVKGNQQARAPDADSSTAVGK